MNDIELAIAGLVAELCELEERRDIVYKRLRELQGRWKATVGVKDDLMCNKVLGLLSRLPPDAPVMSLSTLCSTMGVVKERTLAAVERLVGEGRLVREGEKGLRLGPGAP